MNKLILFVALVLTLATTGCKKPSENNNSLEFDKIDVNFGGNLTDRSWKEGDEIGIFSTATRQDQPNTSISTNVNAKYQARISGDALYFNKVSDNDRIIATASDHNFKFYAYFPYSSISASTASLPAQVPAVQQYSLGVHSYGLYVANKQVTTVVPTVKLDFKGIFSALELYLPNDIINDAGNSVIRSLTVRPSVSANFDGTLADGGMFNLATGVFTSDMNLQSNSIQVDFGTTGLALTDAFTKVAVAVSPFSVPEGGLDVVLKELSGTETIVKVLSNSADVGTVLAAGKVMTQYLSKFNDGVIPVNFPVVFPLGKSNNVANFTSATQPRWGSEGVWANPTQTQAYAQWRKVSDPATSPTQFIEIVNSGNISSPGMKGIWTGDYLEFNLPVKKFAAGTAVTVKFPMYTRQGPVFWNIEYLDGDVWKSNKTNVTSYDPVYSRQATFALIRGGKIIEHTMVFTQAIESGVLKVRVTCADGTIQADTDTKVAVRSTPWISGSAYGAPFYLHLEGSDVSSVTFSTN